MGESLRGYYRPLRREFKVEPTEGRPQVTYKEAISNL